MSLFAFTTGLGCGLWVEGILIPFLSGCMELAIMLFSNMGVRFRTVGLMCDCRDLCGSFLLFRISVLWGF